MRSSKQIAASRANGARSKGPVTAQGKCNSSQNSLRHGLFARAAVLKQEGPTQFMVVLMELMDEHQPTTPTEYMVVETLAVARWRLYRIWELQRVSFEHDGDFDHSRSFRSSADTVRAQELLLGYEVALDRQFNRAFHRLNQLRGAEDTSSAKRTQEDVENISPAPTPVAKPPAPATEFGAPEPRPSGLHDTLASTPSRPDRKTPCIKE